MSLQMPPPTTDPLPNLKSFKILSFDEYGTLIEYKRHILDSFNILLSRLPSDSPYKDDEPLSTHIPNSATTGQITFLKLFQKQEDAIKLERPIRRFDEILKEIWRRIAKDLDVSTTDKEVDAFGSEANIASWKPFDGTVEALRVLQKHYKLVALSNIDAYATNITSKSTGLGKIEWNRVFTAEAFGEDLEKADEAKLETLLRYAEEQGVRKDEVLHVAQSLGHDHAPCKKLGINSVFLVGDGPIWGKEAESKMVLEKGLVGYGWRCKDLREFAGVVEKEFGSTS